MSETFPKSHRLILQKDFAFMKTDSSRIREDSVLFVYKASRVENIQSTRLGIIVSKKNGNAVRRNRIKRILRELYRKSELNLLDSAYDFLIIANVPKDKKFEELSQFLTPLFNKVVSRFSENIK